MDTLPDYLRPGLRLLSIGLNPSLPSVAAGYYFANPRNRFWTALNASELPAAPLVPEVERQCVERHGFTIKQVWGMSEISPLGTIVRSRTRAPRSSQHPRVHSP